MKKLIAIVGVVIVFAGCLKDDGNYGSGTASCNEVSVTANPSEVAALKTYLDTNNIKLTQDPRGFFYKIDTITAGAKPKVCNTITVDYFGYFLNGVQFDANTNVSFALNSLIIGWQEALTSVTVGSTITMYLPPSLAYGSSATGNIPANSYLKFIVRLNAVK